MLLLRHVKSEPLTPPHLLLLALRPLLGDVYLDPTFLGGRLLRGSLARRRLTGRRFPRGRFLSFRDGLLLHGSFGLTFRGGLHLLKANLHFGALGQHEVLDGDGSVALVRLDREALRLDGSFSFARGLERGFLDFRPAALEGDLRALQYIDR